MTSVPLLNINQLKAVNWSKGPLLVHAGPGSGKTSVLTHRIAHIIEESPEDSFRILGITFTNKAATVMRKRVKDLVPNADERVTLTTFHAFCAAILRQHGHFLDIRPDFDILSTDKEQMVVLNKAVEKTGIERISGYTNKQLLSQMGKLTARGISYDNGAEFLQHGSTNNALLIGKIYRHYRRLMIENNELDFSGIVAEALRLLTTTTVGTIVRRIYPYVCVDEFQDTSPLQYEVLCSIVDPSTTNLFVVADNDQLIFEWTGASPRRLVSLQQRFNMEAMVLPENYRCPPAVVEIANKLIVHNSSHSRIDSVASKPDNPDHTIRVKEFDTDEDEVDWIAKDIARRPANMRGNCAILAVTHNVLKQVVAALKIYGIHGYHPIKKEFTNNRIVWLYSILRLANSRQDDEQLHRICKLFEIFEGVNIVMADVVSEAIAKDGDYLRAWVRVALREQLSLTTKLFLANSMSRLIDKLDVLSFTRDCFEWFERKQIFDSESVDKTEYMEEKDIWNTLITEISDDMGWHDHIPLSALLQQIAIRSKTLPIPKGAIPCYTIHASKGMEFDHVYLVRLIEDELPSWAAVNKGDESSAMEGARRVCFVAITRTQKSLTLTYPLHVSGLEKKPSRFLTEMGVQLT